MEIDLIFTKFRGERGNEQREKNTVELEESEGEPGTTRNVPRATLPGDVNGPPFVSFKAAKRHVVPHRVFPEIFWLTSTI